MDCVYCRMRTLLIAALLFCSVKSFAQQDYFYAETLIDNGQYAEAVRVLDHLIDSGAYNDRPRFLMMTLNLAGTTKQYLKDTSGAKKCFESVMACYDTLSGPRRSDDWNRREYYKGSSNLARLHFESQHWTTANTILAKIGEPGEYYSATGSDVLNAQEDYCQLRTSVFQKLNQPDSAFDYIRKIRDRQNVPVQFLDSIFDVPTNFIQHVKFVSYSPKSENTNHIPGYLYFAAWTDETNNQHSIWFINPDRGQIQIISHSVFNQNNPQNFPANCNDMSLSPDEKYLAVTCYTEGSNHIDIFGFPEILNEKRCVLKQSILAYPSSVEIKGWENAQLILECDQDLLRLNKKAHPNWDVTENPDVKYLFLFDPETGKYTKK